MKRKPPTPCPITSSGPHCSPRPFSFHSALDVVSIHHQSQTCPASVTQPWTLLLLSAPFSSHRDPVSSHHPALDPKSTQAPALGSQALQMSQHPQFQKPHACSVLNHVSVFMGKMMPHSTVHGVVSNAPHTASIGGETSDTSSTQPGHTPSPHSCHPPSPVSTLRPPQCPFWDTPLALPCLLLLNFGPSP